MPQSIDSDPAMTVMAITEKLAVLRGRVTGACRQVGRDPGEICIVGVSKKHPPAAIRAASAAGLRHFGENYVQEAIGKISSLPAGNSWHFIGRMQANKTRLIAAHFDWVQTVTSLRLAERLAGQRSFHAPKLQLCIQVAPEPDAGRGGVRGAEILALAAGIAGLPRLQLRGLMFMPLPGLDPTTLRAEFRRVHGLFMMLRERHEGLDTLSMGMSDDLEIAIAEGSTMVRTGTALFGERTQTTP